MLRLILSTLSIICDPMRPLLLLTLLLNWSVAFGQEKVLVLPGKLPIAQLSLQPTIPNTPSIHRIQMPKRAQPTTAVLIFFSAALGAMLFMSLFTFAQFLLNRDASYGWYAAYMTATSLWLWQAISSLFDVIPRLSDQAIWLSFMVVLGYGMMVSYVRFISCLFEVSQKHPHLARWFRFFLGYLAVSRLASLVGLLIWNSSLVYTVSGLVSYIWMLISMVQLLRLRHPLMRYVLTGTTLLVSSAIIALFLNFSNSESTDELIRMPLFYVAIGTLLEILCFSLALGRRFQLNKDETIRTQQQLIGQLEANRQLQQTHSLELTRTLAQREAEVLTKAHELEEQRISQLQSDFVRQIAEAEMAGLRSQMNPHFIFNCLNSIKLYATENDSEKASDYLTKFSRLIRMVLENSRSERVTLQNELEMIRLYTDLEIMRFKQKLSFSIDIDTGIDTRFVEIPPLLIQPYVENAIWHGLMHKPEGGSVHLQVTHPQDDLLQLTITDDGVGRARATELQSKSASHRKSFGLKMTSERIALVNQLYHTHTNVQIEDLMDAEGQPAGTEVTIQIPI